MAITGPNARSSMIWQSHEQGVEFPPMRKSFLRLLAVLVLGLAVAGQGMAAVAAGQCMAFGHHQDSGDHGHGDAHEGADQHDHAAAQDDGGAASAHCGPCAACCASASIAGPAGHPVLSFSSNAKYLFAQAAPPAVQLHRLDRPPLAL
jgi:hypothetical protein